MTPSEARAAAHVLLGPSKNCTAERCNALCERIQANELRHARENPSRREAISERAKRMEEKQRLCDLGIEKCDPSCLYFNGAVPVPCESCKTIHAAPECP